MSLDFVAKIIIIAVGVEHVGKVSSFYLEQVEGLDNLRSVSVFRPNAQL